jgi:hypothetical protein
MRASQQRLVLVGSPTEATAVERWAAVLRWAAHHGWETTSRVGGGPIRYAIATEEVLDGLCSPTEAAVLHAVHTAGIRCVSVYEAPALLAGGPTFPPMRV